MASLKGWNHRWSFARSRDASIVIKTTRERNRSCGNAPDTLSFLSLLARCLPETLCAALQHPCDTSWLFVLANSVDWRWARHVPASLKVAASRIRPPGTHYQITRCFPLIFVCSNIAGRVRNWTVNTNYPLYRVRLAVSSHYFLPDYRIIRVIVSHL